MRIGEIAALVGVTPRAVRHYHHLGLLPEPVRRANGYREYGIKDAILLARIRRLTELGLGLDEVRDVLADDAGRELLEVLEELDTDLGRQEALIRERRARLAELLGEARAGRLNAEGPVSAELAELLAGMGEVPASPMAAQDRELLVLLDTVAPAEERQRLIGAMREMTATPAARDRAHEMYARLDALADADPDDPRVAQAGEALAACLPDAVVAGLDGPGLPEGRLTDTFFGDFSPAQTAAVHHALRLVQERQARERAQ
ncbi:MerR family DNA-binding transcriptional regulator [Streptomyces sp. QHH-9511]|uniref:MerR family transcriptional regulator n=1 Tax=Streptomyces sp. QHH-9511 TaxID=2684468 RepID=UPI0013191220|nr:MerR family transcriptional regulator [Streptomyces sp. QHH-9511]QGZ48685.1 MerR family DNA-binding transcriptional regulator [Streptomyces sp. QHH-9511]